MQKIMAVPDPISSKQSLVNCNGGKGEDLQADRGAGVKGGPGQNGGPLVPRAPYESSHRRLDQVG